MKEALLIFLGVVAIAVIANLAYNHGRSSVPSSSSNTMLCQDALARRRQADQALTAPPPSGDYRVVYEYQRRLTEARNLRNVADADFRRYC